MQRMVEPLGASAAMRRAPAKVAPELMPTKIPSFWASSLLQRMASGLVTRRTLWMRLVLIASSASLGMKSGLQPCWGCGVQEGWLVEGEPSGLLAGWGMPLETMGAASGSQRIILV